MQTSDEPIISDPTPPSAPARRGGGRRLLWVTLATLIVAMLVVLGLAAISALGVRRHLVEGRDALTRGKDELVDGDAATARIASGVFPTNGIASTIDSQIDREPSAAARNS